MENNKKGKSLTIIIIVAAVTIVALIATALILIFGNAGGKNNDNNSKPTSGNSSVVSVPDDGSNNASGNGNNNTSSGGNSSTTDDVKQIAKTAYDKYIKDNPKQSNSSFVYEYGSQFITIKNGKATGVYDSASAALKALFDDPKTKNDDESAFYTVKDTNVAHLQICVEQKACGVSFNKNVMTIIQKNNKKTVVELPTNTMFTEKNLASGVVTPANKATSQLKQFGLNLAFNVQDVNVDLYATITNIPKGYYVKYFTYGYGSSSTPITTDWTQYSGDSTFVYDSEEIKYKGLTKYAISFCFYSSDTNQPVKAPSGGWSISLHKFGKPTPDYTYKIVDSKGQGDYKNVVDAVANESPGTVIIILPGTYEGTIEAFKKNIILVGVDRETCLLKSYDGRYEKPVINGSCGFFTNLTLHSEYVKGVSNEIGTASGAYAFHCEDEYGVGKTLEFRNCTLISDFFPALGMGVRKDFTCIIDNCELINNQVAGRGNYVPQGSLGALYFHDSTGAKGDSYVIVKDSTLKSKQANALCPYSLIGLFDNADKNKVYCTFINNNIDGQIWDRNGNAFTKNFVLTKDSKGNNLDRLNYK